ncbi:PREDICTED: protogenin B-like [Ceratosolen solmsi marchali]|uniref:Protogenin B-like n=1 Tax=Ceratosolen solmsi marchali TaxID=326594 RepID=A0AAJ6YKY9_9HYME|nr:PREDICTED: protogenin B-like [Ceratosolen solmsi marchali]
MAARVLLLSILFTEVFWPVCPAGVRVNGVGARNGSKSEGLEVGSARAALQLEVRPRGEVVLGRRGVTLSCTGPGAHGKLTWLHNDKAAPPCGTTRCSLVHNGSLRLYKKSSIMQKRKGREGNGTQSTRSTQRNEYRCVSHTSYGVSLRSSPTNILYAELSHAFKESPEDLTVHEGEVSKLSCFIDSVPFPPNITWLHNGEIIGTDNNKTKYAFIVPGLLYISETNLADAGSYRCVAANDYLNVVKKSREAKLTVISKNDSKESHNPVSLFPQSSYRHSPLNGTDLRLACAASGYPTPMTTWTFVPQYADIEAAKPQCLVNSSLGLAILELNNISTLNAGVYICSMKNLTNNSTELQNVTVEVLVPPSFIKKPSNQICPNGRTARFECQAQGFPVPRIYWLRNSEDIAINGRKTIYVKEFNKMELAISATVPSDSGIYQCVAVNAAGEIWAAGRLQVNTSRNSPAAPTSLKCEARSPIKMFISWEPPNFLPFTNITAYTVHYRPVEGGKEEVSPPEPGNSTSVEVTKLLEPFTNYTFYVRLWNNHGASDQSATITCSTNASVPKTAPKISINVISSTRLNVTWKPLDRKEAQGIVTEYKLEWRLFQHPSVRVRTLSADVEQFILSDLIPGEQYDLRVLARTSLGWPNVTESQLGWVTTTMPSSNDFTQIQILILNSTTIMVKWNIRTSSIIQFTSWKIYCKNEDGITIVSVDLTKNSTEYILTNLVPNAPYTIELCALSNGEKVHCITKRIDLKKISTSLVPTALEAIPTSSSSIRLSWLSGTPNETNSFEVCYHLVHFSNESSICIPVNSTQVMITNLKSFKLYQFKVKALNKNSDHNPYSETIECYTNEDVPGKVEDIEWFLENGTKVRVAWKEPNKINGVIQSYFLAYSMDRSEPRSCWNNITVYGNKTSANLPGLVAGKRYFVIIQAATKAGFGNPSEPIIILTGGGASESPSSLDEQKPLPKTKEDKKLGIILGIGISLICIVVCLCSMYCRRKYESLRSLRESAQPLKSRILTRNGNSCCVDRSSTSVSQPAVTSNEIELAVLCPPTPISTNPLCDTKGGHANGIVESCAKEPLLGPWEMNGIRKDLRITENPQYKPRDSDDSRISQEQLEPPNLDITQLTTVNYDMDDSNESMNNNMGCCTADGITEPISQKAAPMLVPMLGPNG